MCGIIFMYTETVAKQLYSKLCTLKQLHNNYTYNNSKEAPFMTNKWKKKNERWTYPPGRTPSSERIHWQGGAILSSPNSFATTRWKCHHLPLSPSTS